MLTSKTIIITTNAALQPIWCMTSNGEFVAYSVINTGKFAVGCVKYPVGKLSANIAVKSSGAVSPETLDRERSIPVSKLFFALRQTI